LAYFLKSVKKVIIKGQKENLDIMSKRFLIILVVLAALFAGFLWFSKAKETAKAPSGNETGKVSNHVAGSGNKKVTIIEYGDFECPACGAYYPIIEQVREKYGEDITFQFRNFPLVQIHKNAMAAHRAAEAADKQGKFWEMYNVLYSQQQSWTASGNPSRVMEDYALQLGLNIDKFKSDVASSSVNDTINADVKAGQAIGASATPTFVINGKKIDPLPDRTIEAFSKLIDEAIAKANTESNPQNQ
jgi:protein-disulfide isomerase